MQCRNHPGKVGKETSQPAARPGSPGEPQGWEIKLPQARRRRPEDACHTVWAKRTRSRAGGTRGGIPVQPVAGSSRDSDLSLFCSSATKTSPAAPTSCVRDDPAPAPAPDRCCRMRPPPLRFLSLVPGPGRAALHPPPRLPHPSRHPPSPQNPVPSPTNPPPREGSKTGFRCPEQSIWGGKGGCNGTWGGSEELQRGSFEKGG